MTLTVAPTTHPDSLPGGCRTWGADCKTTAAGFTLIEILVALVIAAVALTAAVRALGFSTEQAQALRERQLAMLSAENHLAELRLSGAWPSPGNQSASCPQGRLSLTCRQHVQTTQNAGFRQVTVTVTQGDGPALARLTSIVSRQP